MKEFNVIVIYNTKLNLQIITYYSFISYVIPHLAYVTNLCYMIKNVYSY